MYEGLAIGLSVALLVAAVMLAVLCHMTERLTDRLMSRDFSEYASGRSIIELRGDEGRDQGIPPTPAQDIGHEDADGTPLEDLAAKAEAGFARFVGPPMRM
jgi:hypothetical protein